jgi:hypothetical protein
MGFEDMPVISGLIIVYASESLHVVNHNNIKSTGRAFSVLDHLLERPSAQRTCTAYGIVDVELYQLKAVPGDVFLQGFLLVANGLFLAVCGTADIADRPVILACSDLLFKHITGFP